MGLLTMARGLARMALSIEGGFAEQQTTFTTPSSVSPPATAIIPAFPVRHHFAIDSNGRQVSTRTERITFHEDVLAATGYPVRNSADMIALKGHFVSYINHQTILCKRVINDVYPSERVGIIVCILDDAL